MTSRSNRIRGVLAAVVSLSLVAAACGDDDDDDAGGAADRTPSTPPTRRRPETTAAAGRLTRPPPAARHDRRRAPTPRPPRTPPRRTEGTEGTEPAGEAFQVPTDNCPPDGDRGARRRRADQDRLRRPADRPARRVRRDRPGDAGLLRQDQRGGRSSMVIRLELVTKDDAYDPARSAPAVQEAIEGDGIFASVFQVGTPNVARHPPAPRRRLRAAGARRHRLPGLGRPAELPVDARAASRPTASSRRCGSSSSRRSSRTPRRSPC